MNIVKKVTLRHLQSNKQRTVMTIFGITISVAMITAVFVAIASFMNLEGQANKYQNGEMEFSVMALNRDQIAELKNDKRIARVGIKLETKTQSFQVDGSESYNLRTGDYYLGDTTSLQQVMNGKYEGSIPKKENEIAVEKEFLEKNNLNLKIGDSIKLRIGRREDQNGDTIRTLYQSGEKFKTARTETFKITAILHHNLATNYYKILRVCDTSALKFAQDDDVVVMVSLKKVDHNSLKEINQIMKDYGITSDQANIQKEYLATHLAVDWNSDSAKSLGMIVGILLVIILIASVVLIFNAFSMSLGERVKYLGMLASVGATRKQKKASVYFEGFLLGIIGIPLGLICGIAGIAITLKAVGGKLVSSGIDPVLIENGMKMQTVVPLWAVIMIVALGILTIAISCIIPARKASAISPISAIRQTNEIKVKAKKLKTPRFIRFLFGYEGEIAHKNMKRNGRKSRVITWSITLSVILFLICNYFCSMIQGSSYMNRGQNYQVEVYGSNSKKLKELVKEVPYVDRAYSSNSQITYVGKDYKDVAGHFSDPQNLTEKYQKLYNHNVVCYINYLDDSEFKQLCEDNGVDAKQYYGKTCKGLLMNNVSHVKNEDSVFQKSIIGSSVNLMDNVDLQIGALIKYNPDDPLCKLNEKDSISIYMPYSSYLKKVKEVDKEEYEFARSAYSLAVETQKHEKVTSALQDLIEEKGITQVSVNDIVASSESMKATTFVMQVFIYGFIVLITLITVVNIINTISTGINLRKKEFAMLKSVGMTPKGMRKMICMETAFYGMKSLIVGLPVSVLLSYLMYSADHSQNTVFQINWVLYFIVICMVFLIIGSTMIYSMSKLKKTSIIETIKDDVI